MIISNLIRSLVTYLDSFEQKKIIFFLKKLLNYPIIAFDVGAHHGESIKLIKNNFMVKSIHSFEASSKNYQMLLKKIKNNSLGNSIFINNIGLGEEKKNTFINQTIESSSSTINQINYNSNYFKKKKIY